MGSILILFLLVWNFGISWLNCWFVGKSWAEAQAIGGWTKVVTYSAAVMGACGFIWINTLVLGFLASTHVGLLPLKYQLTDARLDLLINMGYALIIFPVLGSGLMIWVDSVKQAYKNRDAMSIGVAAYNTFAMAHNAYDAAELLPTIGKKIKDSLNDSDNKGSLLVVYLVLGLSVGLGLLMAYGIIHSTAVKTAQAAKIAALEAQAGTQKA